MIQLSAASISSHADLLPVHFLHMLNYSPYIAHRRKLKKPLGSFRILQIHSCARVRQQTVLGSLWPVFESMCVNGPLACGYHSRLLLPADFVETPCCSFVHNLNNFKCLFLQLISYVFKLFYRLQVIFFISTTVMIHMSWQCLIYFKHIRIYKTSTQSLQILYLCFV